MKLKLVKPLAVFDIEATGLNVTTDRIIEIAIVKLHPDGSQENYLKRVNPQMPISKEASEVTGIRDQDLVNEPTFEQLAEEIAAFIDDADLAGYNSNKFDIPMLAEEFLRCQHSINFSKKNFVDVQNIFHKMEQRTLVAAYQFYCQKDLTNAHNALSDAEATLEVLIAQLEKYNELSEKVNELAEFSRAGDFKLLDFAGRLAVNKNGEGIYNFGKHKGKTIEEVMQLEPGYYGWMLDAEFPLYTKQMLREEMEKIKAKNKPEDKIEDKLKALQNKFNK